jgi:hypothetical protein
MCISLRVCTLAAREPLGWSSASRLWWRSDCRSLLLELCTRLATSMPINECRHTRLVCAVSRG